jgi:hypothetical protein
MSLGRSSALNAVPAEQILILQPLEQSRSR